MIQYHHRIKGGKKMGRKRFAQFVIFIICCSLLSSCNTTGKEIVKGNTSLNISENGASKFELLPKEFPPTNGGATTDQSTIHSIIDHLNQLEFEFSTKDDNYYFGFLGGGDTFEVTYENETVVQYQISGNAIRKPEGTWIEKVDRDFYIRNYLVEMLSIKLQPDEIPLRIPENGITDIRYEPVNDPDSRYIITEQTEIRKTIDKLNMTSYLVCSYKTQFDDPYGYLLISYEDGSVIKLGDAGHYLYNSDQTWLMQINSELDLTGFLSDIFGFDYTQIKK